MATTLNLQIDGTGPSFQAVDRSDEEGYDAPDDAAHARAAATEMSRVLSRVAEGVSTGAAGGQVEDSNGNVIATWSVEHS